jgi:hypothetical protein
MGVSVTMRLAKAAAPQGETTKTVERTDVLIVPSLTVEILLLVVFG